MKELQRVDLLDKIRDQKKTLREIYLCGGKSGALFRHLERSVLVKLNDKSLEDLLRKLVELGNTKAHLFYVNFRSNDDAITTMKILGVKGSPEQMMLELHFQAFDEGLKEIIRGIQEKTAIHQKRHPRRIK